MTTLLVGNLDSPNCDYVILTQRVSVTLGYVNRKPAKRYDGKSLGRKRVDHRDRRTSKSPSREKSIVDHFLSRVDESVP